MCIRDSLRTARPQHMDERHLRHPRHHAGNQRRFALVHGVKADGLHVANRRVQNAPAWQKAGREEQVYSLSLIHI